MLRKQWVDCEGWDVITVIKGDAGSTLDAESTGAAALIEQTHRKRLARLKQENRLSARSTNQRTLAAEESDQPRAPKRRRAALSADVALEEVRRAIEQENAVVACQLDKRFRATVPTWHLPERESLQLIRLLNKQQRWDESIIMMHEYLDNYHARATDIRLNLAQVLLHQQQPQNAARVLQSLDVTSLDARQQTQLQRINQRLGTRQAEGVLEMSDDS